MWINSSGMDDEEFNRIMKRVEEALSFIKAAKASEIVLTDVQRESLTRFCTEAGLGIIDSQGFDSHFGVCPLCFKSGVMRNIEKSHVMACDAHKVRWDVGSNLFSAWQHELESVWLANAALLAGYTDVNEEVNQIISASASAERKTDRGDDVEVEHIAHKDACAIHRHTVGVPCDCSAVGWFEIMPRKDYEVMLPKGRMTEADIELSRQEKVEV